MTNNNSNDALFVTFRNAVYQKLVQRGFLNADTDTVDHPAIDAAIEYWYEQEGSSMTMISENIVGAITHMQNALDSWQGYAPEPLYITTMKVSLSFPTGVGGATFDLEYMVPQGTPPTPEALAALQIQAYDLLKQTYAITAAKRSVQGIPPNAPAVDKATGLPEVQNSGRPEEIAIVEAIYVAVERGKLVVKVKGGKYMKHGVNCYPEVYEDAFKEIGMNIDSFKHGFDTPIRGKMAVVRGDKAEKVTRLKLLAPKKE